MIQKIAKECNISSTLAEILYNRGLKTVDEVKDYLNPTEEDLFSPDMFFDMENAVKTIEEHIEARSKILIYGDYDVDGIFGAFVLRKALEHYDNAYVFIPSRNVGTRGLNKEFCEGMLTNGINLLITVDNCINDVEMVDFLRKNGVDVIITDHHETNGIKPNANAILDPAVSNSGYPFKGLSGSGVAFKLGLKITQNRNYKEEIMPIVAVATIADYMPLVGENRYIVKTGMQGVLKNKALASLYRKAGGKSLKKAKDLSFYMINIINSCGRISDGRFAYELLAESDKELYVIEDTCNKLLGFDEERKRQKIEALIKVENGDSVIFENENFIITLHDDIVPGILGLVPISLMSKTGKNVFSFRKVIEDGKEIYGGSVRGVGNCDLLNQVKTLGDKLITIGGHQNSFGMSIESKNILELIRVLQNITIVEIVSDELIYDVEINLKDFDTSIRNELLKMEPTGAGNPGARILIKDVSIRNISEYRNQTTCQILNDDIYRNAKSQNKLNIRNDWTYDVVVDDELNIIDYKENKLILKSYETGVDTRELSLLGITKKKEEELNKKKIYNINDLLCKMPTKYIDSRITYQVKDIKDRVAKKDSPDIVSIVGTIKEIKFSEKLKVICECVDDYGDVFYVGWFYDWVKSSLYVGLRMLFTGNVRFFQREIMISPYGLKYCGRDIDGLKKIHPLYTLGSKPSDDYFRSRIATALETTNKDDYLERDVLEKFNLSVRKDAFRMVHTPSDMWDIENGAYRMAFDKMFTFAYNMAIKNKEEDKEDYPVFKAKKTFDSFSKIVPYKLTKDQNETIEKIISICGEGKKLDALLQADVGYGKTIVAIYLALLAASNGYQTMVMTPTKILAEQHYKEFTKRLNSFGVKVALVNDKLKAKEKREIQEKIKNREVMVVIGTNGILNLEYDNLGVFICDEEHKFGVRHKEKIKSKTEHVHYLSLSATPIPRTIAEVAYGDMQVFWLKEKPGNRPDIITEIVRDIDKINDKIIEEINKDNRVYVVCPMIDEGVLTEKYDVVSVYEVEKELKKLFKDKGIDCGIALISGKTKPEEVENIMEKFETGEIKVIVATTVVEVGLDVQDATLMVVRNSERFGIAQLHQLRGRVGRGTKQSYCILEPKETNETRSIIVASTLDGEKIAVEDAKNRGYGKLLGDEQSGNNKIIELIMKNEKLFDDIRKEVKEIIKDDSRKQYYDELTKESIKEG